MWGVTKVLGTTRCFGVIDDRTIEMKRSNGIQRDPPQIFTRPRPTSLGKVGFGNFCIHCNSVHPRREFFTTTACAWNCPTKFPGTGHEARASGKVSFLLLSAEKSVKRLMGLHRATPPITAGPAQLALESHFPGQPHCFHRSAGTWQGRVILLKDSEFQIVASAMETRCAPSPHLDRAHDPDPPVQGPRTPLAPGS
jgi:hypothetical protein